MGEAVSYLVFTPWRKIMAWRDKSVDRQYLRDVGNKVVAVYKAGMQGPKSGRVYGKHRASAPGEYPARPTGRLFRTIGKTETSSSVEVGTKMFYAIFLRRGTRKMARRKMADNALQEAMRNPPAIGRFARFR